MIVEKLLLNSIFGVFKMRTKCLLLHQGKSAGNLWFENTCWQALTVVIRQMTKVTTHCSARYDLAASTNKAAKHYDIRWFLICSLGRPGVHGRNIHGKDGWRTKRSTVGQHLITCTVQVTLPTSKDTLSLPAVNSWGPSP
jgi:hypothetical protein